MNKILSAIINSLFATVNAKKGALGSSLGVILGLLPLYGARIPLLFALVVISFYFVVFLAGISLAVTIQKYQVEKREKVSNNVPFKKEHRQVVMVPNKTIGN